MDTLFIVDIKKWQVTTTFFLFFFLSAVFTPVSCAISHLKEDKKSFEEKKYFAIKTPCMLNHATKMAYNLHKLSVNF